MDSLGQAICTKKSTYTDVSRSTLTSEAISTMYSKTPYTFFINLSRIPVFPCLPKAPKMKQSLFRLPLRARSISSALRESIVWVAYFSYVSYRL